MLWWDADCTAHVCEEPEREKEKEGEDQGEKGLSVRLSPTTTQHLPQTCTFGGVES